MYSRDASRTDKDHLIKRFGHESFSALLDMLFMPVTRSIPAEIPRLVVGAEFDNVFSAQAVQATAKKHGVNPVMLPLSSHMIPVDDRWSDAATVIKRWLDQTFPRPAEKPAIEVKPIAANSNISNKPIQNIQPDDQKRPKMLGRMMLKPLILSSLLEHVERLYADKPILSRELVSELGEIGPIHVTSWGEVCNTKQAPGVRSRQSRHRGG